MQRQKAGWDALVRLALVQVWNRVGSPQDLRKIAAAKGVEGRKEDEGYKFLPKEGFSSQGVSAQDAAQILFHCAKALEGRRSCRGPVALEAGCPAAGRMCPVGISRPRKMHARVARIDVIDLLQP